MQSKKKEYKFRRNIDIGHLEAEEDKFLLNAFVEKPDYTILKDTSDSKSIILGRTGSGKSALIRRLESEETLLKRINPEDLSLRHLSNSTIISYFTDLDVKLNLFYKVLWKHVFVVELIKLHFGGDSDKSNNALNWLFKHFSKDKAKKQAIEYLKNWEDKFWETTEYQIKAVEHQLESNFKSSIDNTISFYEHFKSTGKLSTELLSSEKIVTEVKHKSQRIISDLQIENLNQIISILKDDIFKKTQKDYYIVIDDLDKDWVDSKIVYDIIRGLIETIKEFQRIPRIKIIIALRTNIKKIIFHQNRARGTQREKYNQLFLTINWTQDDLVQLIDKRLGILMKETYTNSSPKMSDILPIQNKKYSNATSYILKRTIMRPRDILDFFNKIIKYADGKTKINWDIIKKAEVEYSHERLNAVEDEWLENYGETSVFYNSLKNGAQSFNFQTIKEDFKEYLLNLIVEDEVKRLSLTLQEKFERYDEEYFEIYAKEILCILYEIGILGIKTNPENSTNFIYEDFIPIEESDIDLGVAKFVVHPMFFQALKIK